MNGKVARCLTCVGVNTSKVLRLRRSTGEKSISWNSSVETPLKLMLYGPVGLRLKWCSIYSGCCLSQKGKWICLSGASDSHTTASISSSPPTLTVVLDSRFARTLLETT